MRMRTGVQTQKKIFFHVFPAVVLIFILSACSRNTDWVQFRGEGGRGVSSSRIAPPLGLRWKIKLQDSDEILRSLNPPVVIGDTIYFGSDDGNFYALDVESGYMRWVFKSGAEINSIPYADKEQVYFGSKDGKLYALSRDKGEEIWNFPVRSQINSQVQRYRDSIIFVGDADAIYYLSPDGKEQFRINNPGWYNFTFLMADDVMYFATGPVVEQVGPYDINKKEYLWFLPYHEIKATWYSFCAIRGDLLYLGTADMIDGTTLGYYAINRHTGKIVWKHVDEGKFHREYVRNYLNEFVPYVDFEMEFLYFLRNIDLLDFMAPTVWKDLVIWTGGDCAARAFDADTGILRWEKMFDTPISSAPTLAAGRVYFGLLGGEGNPPQLVCLSAKDGRVLWQMETEGSILSAPVIAGKRIVFGTDLSVFYVLEQVF
ncbi:MAG: PQQ-binding-like beta-propeller repeat protein [Treponema sp.]|nr:PQQ-binding-like beta-propeller repeat protein [Treponema sp.]MCL2272935.1 PQQ-binding-like beta-propeller repeat protein [Treponema sp.]